MAWACQEEPAENEVQLHKRSKVNASPCKLPLGDVSDGSEKVKTADVPTLRVNQLIKVSSGRSRI